MKRPEWKPIIDAWTAAALGLSAVLCALTVGRPWGELFAAGACLLSVGALLFCAYWYLRFNLTGETRPKGRALYLAGRVVFWGCVCVVPLALAVWLAGQLH